MLIGKEFVKIYLFNKNKFSNNNALHGDFVNHKRWSVLKKIITIFGAARGGCDSLFLSYTLLKIVCLRCLKTLYNIGGVLSHFISTCYQIS